MLLVIWDSILDEINIKNVIIIIVGSLIYGLIVALTYIFLKKKKVFSQGFPITIIILPVVVSLVIIFVSDNVARSLSLAGIFALTRFRSEQKDTEDITYIFITVGIGLVNGLGYLAYGALFAIFTCAVLIILGLIKFGDWNNNKVKIKVLVPEDLNYEELLDDILSSYCETSALIRTKTTEFGTIFELTYVAYIKKNISRKELIDALRTKNGNLSISIISQCDES